MTLDMTFIIINQCINDMVPISNVLSKDKLNNYISQFVYPIGSFPYEDIKFNYQSLSYTLTQALTYLQDQLTYIFNDYYTEIELEIITFYCYCHYLRRSNTFKIENMNFLISQFEKLIVVQTDKEEIQYIIEDLKYMLLKRYLLEENKEEEISKLIEDLAPIEERHNTFNIRQKSL